VNTQTSRWRQILVIGGTKETTADAAWNVLTTLKRGELKEERIHKLLLHEFDESSRTKEVVVGMRPSLYPSQQTPSGGRYCRTLSDNEVKNEMGLTKEQLHAIKPPRPRGDELGDLMKTSSVGPERRPSARVVALQYGERPKEPESERPAEFKPVPSGLIVKPRGAGGNDTGGGTPPVDNPKPEGPRKPIKP
jgi:hypothetical protein